MLELCDSMSQNAKSQGRFHNPKVGSSSLPPATNPINHLLRSDRERVFHLSRSGHVNLGAWASRPHFFYSQPRVLRLLGALRPPSRVCNASPSECLTNRRSQQ